VRLKENYRTLPGQEIEQEVELCSSVITANVQNSTFGFNFWEGSLKKGVRGKDDARAEKGKEKVH
jgi:hypothetical protein